MAVASPVDSSNFLEGGSVSQLSYHDRQGSSKRVTKRVSFSMDRGGTSARRAHSRQKVSDRGDDRFDGAKSEMSHSLTFEATGKRLTGKGREWEVEVETPTRSVESENSLSPRRAWKKRSSKRRKSIILHPINNTKSSRFHDPQTMQSIGM